MFPTQYAYLTFPVAFSVYIVVMFDVFERMTQRTIDTTMEDCFRTFEAF